MKGIAKKAFYGIVMLSSAILAVVFSAYCKLKPARLDSGFKRILILHFDGSKIGDALLASCVIAPLKKRFPKAKITVFYNTLTKDLVEANPLVDEVLTAKHFNFLKFLEIPKALKLRKKKPDLCLSLTFTPSSHLIALLSGAAARIGWDKSFSGFALNVKIPFPEGRERFRSGRHATKFYYDFLKPLGITEFPDHLQLHSSKKNNESVGKKISAAKTGGRRIVGVHAGSTPDGMLKRWPKERFAELADRLIKERNAFVFFVGSKGEAALNSEIIAAMRHNGKAVNLAGKLSVGELAALCKKCSLFVCNDSAPMHIAAACNTRTVALFGPTNSTLFAPLGKNAKVLKKSLQCMPCYVQGTYPECRHNKCMESITVEEVFSECKNFG